MGPKIENFWNFSEWSMAWNFNWFWLFLSKLQNFEIFQFSLLLIHKLLIFECGSLKTLKQFKQYIFVYYIVKNFENWFSIFL